LESFGVVLNYRLELVGPIQFTPNFYKDIKKKRPQERLTEVEKALIIKSYDMGVSVTTIAGQIGKSTNSIYTFYSRWKLNCTLPLKEKKSRCWIDGRMGLAIKKQIEETPKLGLRKLPKKLKERLPGQSWYL
jgi:transposase